MAWWRRVWRRCPACGGVCHWHDTHWVCDGGMDGGCGSECEVEHDPKFAAPGD